MKIKTLVPFIVILALLLGLVAWRKATEAPPAPLATQLGLESLVPEDLQRGVIARVELYSGGNPDEKVVLERDGDTWHIASLHMAPVNKERLDGFLDKVLALKGEPRATADTEARLAEFDLTEDAAFHVRLFRADEDTPALNVLAGKSADFRTIFLRRAGENRVFVEATDLRRKAGVTGVDAAAKPRQTHWLQTTLLDLDQDSIHRVALVYPDKEMTFERVEVAVEPAVPSDPEDEDTVPAAPETTYEWQLAAGGYSDTFTEQPLQQLLTRFATLSITDVADPEDVAAWGFDPPAYKATLSLEGADDVVLLGGRAAPGGDPYVQIAGSDPPLIYKLSKFNFEQMFPEGNKLFTLPEWEMGEDHINRLEIQRGDEHLVLTRDEEDGWQVTLPDITLDLQKTTVDSLVSAATSIKPTDYADPAYDAGPFDTVITIHTDAGEERTLHLGAHALHTDGRYIRFDDYDAVLVLSRADTGRLDPPTRDLYTLSVLDFDMDAIERMTVSHEDMAVALERDEEDRDTWRRTWDDVAPVLLNDVEDFVYTLNAFQVDDFLLDRNVEDVQPATTITVYKSDQEPVILQLAAESDDMHEAVVSGLPYVFSVRPDELGHILDDLALFTTTPPEEDAEAPEEDVHAAPEELIPDISDETLVLPMDTVDDTTDEADVQVIEIDPSDVPAEATEVLLE